MTINPIKTSLMAVIIINKAAFGRTAHPPALLQSVFGGQVTTRCGNRIGCNLVGSITILRYGKDCLTRAVLSAPSLLVSRGATNNARNGVVVLVNNPYIQLFAVGGKAAQCRSAVLSAIRNALFVH